VTPEKLQVLKRNRENFLMQFAQSAESHARFPSSQLTVDLFCVLHASRRKKKQKKLLIDI
jgi:hypothetical protein